MYGIKVVAYDKCIMYDIKGIESWEIGFPLKGAFNYIIEMLEQRKHTLQIFAYLNILLNE